MARTRAEYRTKGGVSIILVWGTCRQPCLADSRRARSRQVPLTLRGGVRHAWLRRGRRCETRRGHAGEPPMTSVAPLHIQNKLTIKSHTPISASTRLAQHTFESATHCPLADARVPCVCEAEAAAAPCPPLLRAMGCSRRRPRAAGARTCRWTRARRPRPAHVRTCARGGARSLARAHMRTAGHARASRQS